MARPSKAKSPKYAKFAVYEDANANSIPPPDSSYQYSSKSDCRDFDPEHNIDEAVEDTQQFDSLLVDISEDIAPFSTIGEQTDTDIEEHVEKDEDRRESTLTRRTSISSIPESSVFDTDYESSRMPAMHKPYTPPSMRPTFRRPESVRRMQLTASPTPYERTSPRRSVLHARSRTGTPRSVKQSPRPRALRYQEEDDIDEDKKEYPLVLLHVTLLPVELRWSAESMLEILPPNVIENLQLLRSKVSETILHRGILIPHPREEYELLEERLLEALELRKERVTKCGHFRARDSTSSLSSGEESIKSADSGVGSSLDGEDIERCTTCSSPVKGTTTAVDVSGRKWSIKVFAANGLMRASAWTAAWSEMERVDVEILPWIGEGLRKKLDAALELEEHDERQRREDEEVHIKEVVEEQVRIAHEQRMKMDEEERAGCVLTSPSLPEDAPRSAPATAKRRSDLPKVYRAEDIPLSILLKNYVYLLAQDKRNVVFVLVILGIWMSLQAAVLQRPYSDLAPMSPGFKSALPEVTYIEVDIANAAPATGPDDKVMEQDSNDSAVINDMMGIVDDAVKPGAETIVGAEGDTAQMEGDRQPRAIMAEAFLMPTGPVASEQNVKGVCIDNDLADVMFGMKSSFCGTF